MVDLSERENGVWREREGRSCKLRIETRLYLEQHGSGFSFAVTNSLKIGA